MGYIMQRYTVIFCIVTTRTPFIHAAKLETYFLNDETSESVLGSSMRFAIIFSPEVNLIIMVQKGFFYMILR